MDRVWRSRGVHDRRSEREVMDSTAAELRRQVGNGTRELGVQGREP
jgi:hypothetical protein